MIKSRSYLKFPTGEAKLALLETGVCLVTVATSDGSKVNFDVKLEDLIAAVNDLRYSIPVK